MHKSMVEDTHCYVHPMSNFQIMIANGGMMKCGSCCEDAKLQLGNYNIRTYMFMIDMGGCDNVLRVEWLHTLGLDSMDFQELFLSYTLNS